MTDQAHYFTMEPDSPGHTPVYVRRPGKEPRQIDKRLDLANHSPDGFSWGYRGSGPTQLALAILADYYDDGHALQNYKAFAKAFVAEYRDDAPFYVTADEIEHSVGKRV